MKKKLSLFLAILLLQGSFPLTAFALETNHELNANQINLVNELLDTRLALIGQEDYSMLDKIDQDLISLGVKKLTFNEVMGINCNEISPYVEHPVTDNIYWYSYWESYKYNGIQYRVQTVIAQPKKGYASSLLMSGHHVIEKEPSIDWIAGSVNAASVIAYSGVGELIPGASISITIYDSVKAFVSGISKITKITSASISYAYSHTAEVRFKYVRPADAPANSESLAFICSKGITSVGYQYPEFNFIGGSAEPNVIQGKQTVESIPEKYDDNKTAVEAYVNMYTGACDYVSRVKITGPESKIVSYIYPPVPSHPWQLVG